jgi:superfamily I DNA/RNA helicase
MLKRSEATDVSGFMGWLTEWKDREVDRLTKRNKTYSHITDKFEVFEAVCEVSNTLDDLKSNISKLFDDNENDGNLIVCSTVHKWKGNENERAFVLMDTFKKNGGGIEEENIKYVSFTRAKTSLFLVGKGSLVNDAVIAEGEKEVAAIEAAQV